MSMLTSTIPSPLRAEPEHYVSSDEAASFLKLNLRTVQRLAREGTIPAHPFGERSRKTWRFLLSELDVWMKAKVNCPRRPCRSVGR
ncbi:MAG: binding domain protein excisionase family [Acidobacteriaceae bacterium]|nr:binding domain protein excisionase family [Acidobacteriaceae bacterium]